MKKCSALGADLGLTPFACAAPNAAQVQAGRPSRSTPSEVAGLSAEMLPSR
jgi:hypothetical protein